MASGAESKFRELVAYVDQLIQIHGKLQSGRGRRHEQDAIHRAGVVMMAAAWETYIETVLREAPDAIATDAGVSGGISPSPPTPTWARHAFALRRAEIERQIKRFNAPDTRNTRDLLVGSLEFDPRSHWNWRAGPRQWDSREMQTRLDAWMTIRHSVAHGAALPTDIVWLRDPKGMPSLTLKLLRECKRFFEHLAQQTDAAFADHLVAHHGIAKPW